MARGYFRKEANVKNSDPVFRSAIANVEKASTGEALRKALVKYTPAISDAPNRLLGNNTEEVTDDIYEYSGALATLYRSHAANVKNLSDVTWFDPPVIGPKDVLIDFDPRYKYIDQDGNELDF